MRPHVHILMCTMNGAAFLREQLQSFTDQTHKDWSLWVSDDGSTDDTLAILQAFQAAHPTRQIRVFSGRGQGVAANFLSLLQQVDLSRGLIALSDQDDVWLPAFLALAIEKLQMVRAGPALYCCNTWVTTPALKRRHIAYKTMPRPSFQNALVENIAAGNTILMNAPAAVGVARVSLSADIPYHDWWLYLLITGMGGVVLTDDRPLVLYRQHGRNLLGDRRGGRAAWRRLSLIVKGDYRRWLAQYLRAAEQASAHLTAENRDLITRLRHDLPKAGFARRRGFQALNIRRQTLRDNMMLGVFQIMGWA